MKLSRPLSSGSSGSATRALLAAAGLVALAATGHAQEFVAGHVIQNDTDSTNLIEYDADGSIVRHFASAPELAFAEDLVFGPDGRLYASSFASDCVLVFDANGTQVDKFTDAKLSGARGMAIGPNGTLYVASFFDDRVLEFTLDGFMVREIGAGTTLASPYGIAIGPNGHLFVSSIGGNRVHELDQDGKEVRTIGAAVAPDATGISIGPEGNLYVGSSATNSVFRFDGLGVKKAELTLSIQGCNSVEFGPDGLMYVVDTFSLKPFNAVGVVQSPSFQWSTHTRGMAIVPHRFSAKLKGKLLRDGEDPLSVTQNATISVAPGSNRVMVQLAFSPVADFDTVPYALGTAFMSFHGSETFKDDGSKSRHFRGVEMPATALMAGTGSLTVDVKGKLASGRFVPKSLNGRVDRGTATVEFSGTFKTDKLIND